MSLASHPAPLAKNRDCVLQYSSVELIETLRAACLRTLDGLTTLLTTPPPNTQRPPLIGDAATLLQAIFILMVRSCMGLPSLVCEHYGHQQPGLLGCWLLCLSSKERVCPRGKASSLCPWAWILSP